MIDKFLILDTMYDDMERYRGEIRRHCRSNGESSYNYMLFSSEIDAFYRYKCPSDILKKLDILISEETYVSEVFKKLKEKLLTDKLVCSYACLMELIG